MRFVLSGYMWDNYSECSLDITEFVELAKKGGYDGVSLRQTQVNPWMDKTEIQKIKSIIDDNGLFVAMLTVRNLPKQGKERDVYFTQYLELASVLECKLLKIGSDPEWLRCAAEQAGQYGIVLATNNHVNGPLETTEMTLKHLDAVNHSNYGILFDPFHLKLGGSDYIGAVRAFGDRIVNVLIHDEEFFDTGKKGIVWRGIFSELRRLRYQGLITVFDCRGRGLTPDQAVMQCRTRLFNMGVEL